MLANDESITFKPVATGDNKSDTPMSWILFAVVFWVCWRWFLRDWFHGLSATKAVLARVRAHQIPEEAYYEMAGAEIESGALKRGLWLKALAQSKGDENAARARYIELRVSAMRSEAADAIRHASEGKAEDFDSSPREQPTPPKAVVTCPNCSGKSRVAAAKLLDICCPHCRSTFRLKT